ncbi:MAG TPA: hypothetical protein VMS22_23300 [Candidatus Eisenbacteria bacterium]|nr:hypothetical protein [Candidatus Eisenbacteria bacterium]
MAALLGERAGWSPAHVDLFDQAWRLYWERCADLARRTRTWPAPRRRHVAVVTQPEAVRPYVQLLNTSAWLVYACDVDPTVSHPEFLAYVLAVGDRMALTGEVAPAAVHAGAWWLERTDEECAAFSSAAARSTRPDAAAFLAVADALPWLRRLHHETLRTPVLVAPERPVPGTGLLVPASLEEEPVRLVARWRETAERTLARYHASWRRRAPKLVADLCDWLATTRPRLVVTAERGRIVWDPDAPDRLGALRSELKRADAVAAARIRHDLERIASIGERFFAAVVDPSTLPPPAPNTFQTGYTYLYSDRHVIAYNLDEPGMERLQGPALPYEHAMVGARTAHEWAHLADTAGYVRRVAAPDDWAALRAEFAALIEDTIAQAPAAVRRATAADLAALSDGRPLGVALGRVLVTRMPDYRANLVARGLMTDVEAETYVRHNVRTLRGEYPPAGMWRLLLRYMFEYQYLQPALGLTRMEDPRAYFVHSTGLVDDFFAPGIVDEARFDALAGVVARLCACYAIDPEKLRFA